MPGILGIVGEAKKVFDFESLQETIDPISLCDSEVINTGCGFMACSWLKTNTLLPSRLYEDSDYAACFAGDLVDLEDVPWKSIIKNLEHGRHELFSDFRGTFCFAVFRKSHGCLWIISDRISQQPVYYYIRDSLLVFSTTLSTFCRLADAPEFHKEWLYEYLFFNYPIGQTTFLRHVKRMPPATVLKYDLKASNHRLSQYTGRFTRQANLLKGKEALNRALCVFSERVPKYYHKGIKTAVALTAGFDSRTVLAMAPFEIIKDIESYTYGGENCDDILEASRVASAMEIPHRKIVFDAFSLQELPELIYEAVYLSGGLERVTRAVLSYVFRELTNRGQRFPLIITGVSGDHLFRDHINGMGNVPAMISADMMKTFQTGKPLISSAFFKKAFSDQYHPFEDHINAVLDSLRSAYGVLNSPETYLSYLIYEITPKHFAGEASIAGNYSLYRTPYWDSDIMNLAYEIEYGTLGFSERLKMKDRYLECVLQSILIGSNSPLKKIPIKGVPLSSFSRNNKVRYKVDRFVHHGARRIRTWVKPISQEKLADWSTWFHTILEREVDTLISKRSLVGDYFAWEFLKDVRTTKNVHWLGKILTIEIILNLIKKRWTR